MVSQTKRQSARFVARLESMRGIAALIVAASHIGTIPIGDGRMLLNNPGPDLGPVAAFLGRTYVHLTDGLEAVIFFFVLSGFVLTQSLLHGGERPAVASGPFIFGRIFRIYPAVIASVLIFAVALLLSGGETPVTVTAVSSNMLLLGVSLNGVMWSLQLEVLAIPLILGAYLMLFHWKRIGPWAVLALALLLVGLSFVSTWNKLLQPSGASLQFMYAFVFGILIAVIGPRIAPTFWPRGTTVAIVVWIVIFFVARPLLGPSSTWRFIVNALSAAALITLVAFGPRVSSSTRWMVG